MDLKGFETKLNTNQYTKEDIKELLNYAFYLKEKNSELISENMNLEDDVRLWKSNCNR